jgi:hypothetical protein
MGPVWTEWFWNFVVSNVEAIDRLSTSGHERGRDVRDHTPPEVIEAAYRWWQTHPEARRTRGVT